MATTVHESSASLGDAAEAIGQALQYALTAKLPATQADTLRRALASVIDAAKEAGDCARENQRLTRYATRVEERNSSLMARLANLQRQSEQLLQSLAPALDVVNSAFNRAAQFRAATTSNVQLSDETLAAILAAPGMAHTGD